MAPQGPNKILTAWIRHYCSGFAGTDEEVREMSSTPEMAALRSALYLIGSVTSNPAWVDENDPDGNLEDIMRALLKVTRIRRHDSV